MWGIGLNLFIESIIFYGEEVGCLSGYQYFCKSDKKIQLEIEGHVEYGLTRVRSQLFHFT